MKTLHRFSYLLLIAVLLTSSSCIGSLFGGDDDEDGPTADVVTNLALDGDWEGQSFNITNLGESIGEVFGAIELEFDADDDNTGEFSIFYFVLESGTTQAAIVERSGDYIITGDGAAIAFDYDRGSSETYVLNIDGDNLVLNGAFSFGTLDLVGTMLAVRD